jgi:hypothetical protein
MNCADSSQTQQKASSAATFPPLKLEIKGMIVPSFKNSKQLIARGKGGRPLPRPLLITNPRYQKIMAAMVDSFHSQLLSAFQTTGGVTLTGASLRSAIASSVPADDAWRMLRPIHIDAELCKPGEEGVTLTLQRL